VGIKKLKIRTGVILLYIHTISIISFRVIPSYEKLITEKTLLIRKNFIYFLTQDY